MDKRIWGYARVSTREQALNSSALEQQCQRLRDAGATRLFIDVESGGKDKRKQLISLLKEVGMGGCDEVICTRIDRLARSMGTLHKTLAQFQEARVGVRFLDQGLDVATSHGKLMFNMLGSVAEWESDLLSDRVRHGKEYCRSQGKALGTPFGYRRDSEGRHTLDQANYRDTSKPCSEVARELIETFLSVGTLRGTLREMGQRYGRGDRIEGDFPITPHGLFTYLHNPTLRGHLSYKVKGVQQIFRENHPALMSEAEYAEISRISQLTRETRGYKATQGKYAISGLVFCQCGSRCRLRTYGDKQRERYRSTKRNKTYRGEPPKYPEYAYATCIRAADTPGLCDRKKSTPVAAIETAIIKAMCDRAGDIASRIDAAPQLIDTPEILKLRDQVAEIAHLDNPVIAAARRELEGQIEALRLDMVSQASGQVAKAEELQAIGADPEFWRSLSLEKRRRYFRHFVDKVVTDGAGSIEVILSF